MIRANKSLLLMAATMLLLSACGVADIGFRPATPFGNEQPEPVLDPQADNLSTRLADDRIAVVQTEAGLVVTVPGDLAFEEGGTAVSVELFGVLRRLAEHLKSNPATMVEIVGHTDNVGAAGPNQQLSAERAAAVAAILTAEGVTSARLRSIGQGEDAPKASNLKPETRALNRRVEIIIRPIG